MEDKKSNTMRGQRLKQIRLERGFTQEKLAELIEKTKSTISLYERGESFSVDTAIDLSDILGVSVEFILTGKSDKELVELNSTHYMSSEDHLKSIHMENMSADLENLRSMSHIKEREIDFLKDRIRDLEFKLQLKLPKGKDQDQYKTIPIVDIKAAAGAGYVNTEEEEVETIQFPSFLLKPGRHILIRVKGISMSPTMHDGGLALIRFIEPFEWKAIPEEKVFVIADKDAQTYVKRVKNRLIEHRQIVLMSDNPDKSSFPNINLMADELLSIWEVEWYFTAKLPNIHNQYYSKVSRIEDELDVIKMEINKINNKIFGKI